jgi:hypothetical protein
MSLTASVRDSVKDFPADETLREYSYLVERGVRPMASICVFKADETLAALVYAAIASPGVSGQRAVPFVCRDWLGRCHCGYASAPWVIDLYRWSQSGQVPECHRHRIVGLLLGYSSEAIGDFERRRAGCLVSG